MAESVYSTAATAVIGLYHQKETSITEMACSAMAQSSVVRPRPNNCASKNSDQANVSIANSAVNSTFDCQWTPNHWKANLAPRMNATGVVQGKST